ncbi:actin-6-like [Discoglossus pictus]
MSSRSSWSPQRDDAGATQKPGATSGSKSPAASSSSQHSLSKEHCTASSDNSERYKDLVSVIIDTGTGFTKSGFSGEEKPKSVLRSIVGVPKIRGRDTPLYYIGDAIPQGRSNVEKKKVMTHGVVTDWDALEMLWHHIFYTELSICPEELAVLITDAPLSPTTNREKVAELLFENFGVPAMYISHQSLLAMYSYGRTSGLVIESGHGTSYTAPVYDGYVLPHATYRLDVAGEALTSYLSKLMAESGNPFREDEMDLVSDIKEKCCYVSLDIDSEIRHDEKNYLIDFTLPDGQIISIGSERFRCPEALFLPTVLGLPEVGLHAHALSSIQKCAPEHQSQLLSNVVVCGGSSYIRGFPERIKKEMCRAEKGRPPNIFAHPHRKFAPWLGGSIVGALDSFQNLWINRALYDEKGPFVVHRHCF